MGGKQNASLVVLRGRLQSIRILTKSTLAFTTIPKGIHYNTLYLFSAFLILGVLILSTTFIAYIVLGLLGIGGTKAGDIIVEAAQRIHRVNPVAAVGWTSKESFLTLYFTILTIAVGVYGVMSQLFREKHGSVLVFSRPYLVINKLAFRRGRGSIFLKLAVAVRNWKIVSVSVDKVISLLIIASIVYMIAVFVVAEWHASMAVFGIPLLLAMTGFFLVVSWMSALIGPPISAYMHLVSSIPQTFRLPIPGSRRGTTWRIFGPSIFVRRGLWYSKVVIMFSKVLPRRIAYRGVELLFLGIWSVFAALVLMELICLSGVREGYAAFWNLGSVPSSVMIIVLVFLSSMSLAVYGSVKYYMISETIRSFVKRIRLNLWNIVVGVVASLAIIILFLSFILKINLMIVEWKSLSNYIVYGTTLLLLPIIIATPDYILERFLEEETFGPRMLIEYASRLTESLREGSDLEYRDELILTLAMVDMVLIAYAHERLLDRLRDSMESRHFIDYKVLEEYSRLASDISGRIISGRLLTSNGEPEGSDWEFLGKIASLLGIGLIASEIAGSLRSPQDERAVLLTYAALEYVRMNSRSLRPDTYVVLSETASLLYHRVLMARETLGISSPRLYALLRERCASYREIGAELLWITCRYVLSNLKPLAGESLIERRLRNGIGSLEEHRCIPVSSGRS